MLIVPLVRSVRSFIAAASSSLAVQAGFGAPGLPAVVASLVFLLVFLGISMHLLNETTAALLGAVAVFLVTYIGGTFNPDLRILSFDEAMTFVDWNVIFLILGMMIFMAIVSETNVLKWIAFRMYRSAGGSAWVLAAALITLTGVTSAFLNDVTAVLLIVPVSIQLALAIGLDPFSIVIAEVLASNIGGAATLIGDPPSTIVGSHIQVSFGEYMLNMAPVAVICMAALLIYNRHHYRDQYTEADGEISEALYARLESDSKIENHSTLAKSTIVGALTFGMFFFADGFSHMPPSVVALAGAAILIAWVRPDVQSMVREVDWTTLIFFISLFIVVGGMEATGAIEWLAVQIQHFVGGSVYSAAMLLEWVAGIASGLVANIPFTVAALPVADLLTVGFSGAGESKILYWSLILGADLGGNATYIGSAPNIVAIGLLAQAGYKMRFTRFMRDGIPVTFMTLVIASIYILARY